MPSIKDVALHAGVSVATVSRVLSGTGYADQTTRERVLASVKALGYQKNVHWSRLRQQSSQTILFLLGNRDGMNSFHTRLLVACERAVQQQGFDLIFTRHSYDASDPEPALPRLLQNSGAVDGVILAGVHSPNLLRTFDARSLPYSLLGNNFTGDARKTRQNAIFYDDVLGIREATDYLFRLGHRRIAFAGNRALPWFERRFHGYREAVEGHKLDLIELTENWPLSNQDYGQLCVAQILRESRPPTALIAGNDEIAAGAFKELTKRGLRPPADLSLIGLGDRREFSILEPEITSISVFEDQLGERLATMLLDRIRGQKAIPSQTYPCKLIERGSCAPLREVRSMPKLASQ